MQRAIPQRLSSPISLFLEATKRSFHLSKRCRLAVLRNVICVRNRRERDQWGDLGVDGWIILGWISSRGDVGTWTGLGWPRIDRGGGRL